MGRKNGTTVQSSSEKDKKSISAKNSFAVLENTEEDIVQKEDMVSMEKIEDSVNMNPDQDNIKKQIQSNVLPQSEQEQEQGQTDDQSFELFVKQQKKKKEPVIVKREPVKISESNERRRFDTSHNRTDISHNRTDTTYNRTVTTHNKNDKPNGFEKNIVEHMEKNAIEQSDNKSAISEERDGGDVYIPPISGDTWMSSSKKRREREKERNTEYPMDNLEYYDPNVELEGDNMKLHSTWTVWIHENSDQSWSIQSYKAIYRISNVGEMWRFLNYFDNLDKTTRQYYIMRDGITPVWEDNNNKNGGICSIMLENVNRNKNNRSDICIDCFIAICCLVFNESFVKNNMDINGLCYSIKQRNVLIKLWIKDFEINKKFSNKLPINLFHNIGNIMEAESRDDMRRHNGSRISVQIKQIIPEQ